jgi:hypothetical protein
MPPERRKRAATLNKGSGMNITKFKPTAQVDWAEVQFQLKSRSNLQTVQPKLSRILDLSEGKSSSVFVLDAKAGGAASLFAFRIQDPKRFAHVQRVLAALTKRFDLACPPRVTGIEVAFDLFPKKGTTPREDSEAVAHLYKFSTSHPSANHRIYNDLQACEVPARLDSLVRAVEAGYCIGVGYQRESRSKRGTVAADSISARWYHKRHDNGDDLPEDQHRARMEITLQSDRLPFQTLDQLAVFDFNSLQEHFTFRSLKTELDPFVAGVLVNGALPLFAKRVRNRREGGTRLHSPSTVADAALNDAARRALRSLTKRWREGSACGNPVTFDQGNPDSTRDSAASSNNYYNNPSISTPSEPSISNPSTKHNNEASTPTQEQSSGASDEQPAQGNAEGGAGLGSADDAPIRYEDLEGLFPEFFNVPDTEDDLRLAELLPLLTDVQAKRAAVAVAALPLARSFCFSFVISMARIMSVFSVRRLYQSQAP